MDDLRARIERLREARDARADDFDVLVRRVWEAATGDTHEGPASVDVLLDAVAALRAERDALRAIIDGRTVPPTAEEIEAHHAAGGAWLVTLPAVRQVRVRPETRCTDTPSEVSRLWWSEGARWVAITDGRPCAWPVVAAVEGEQ